MKIGSFVKILSTTTPFLVKTVGMYGKIIGVVEEIAYKVQLPEEINCDTQWVYLPRQLREVTDEEEIPKELKNLIQINEESNILLN
jgi:hypothetical protein